MNDVQYEDLGGLRELIFGRQRDLIHRCGGYKRVMDLTRKSKTEVCRWQGGADQDYMPLWAIYVLEKDCGDAIVTATMAEANGRRLSDPEAERLSDVNLHRAYAESVRRRAEVDLAYANAMEDGRMSCSESIIFGRALSAQDRANSELQAANAVIKARGGVPAPLKLVGEDD